MSTKVLEFKETPKVALPPHVLEILGPHLELRKSLAQQYELNEKFIVTILSTASHRFKAGEVGFEDGYWVPIQQKEEQHAPDAE